MNRLFSFILMLILVAGAAGAFYYWKYLDKSQVAVPLQLPQEPQPLSEPEQVPRIIHPVPDDPTGLVESSPPATADDIVSEQAQPEPVKPLPALDASDPDMLATLTGRFDRQTLGTLFNLDGIIRRVVVTVDNLPRSKLSMRHVINQATPGPFLTLGEDENRVLDPANFSRYTPFVRVAEEINTSELVQLYVQVYPLFQQAYQDLGYPSAYFNDRLVEVIDHLLEAPQITGPIPLRQPHVFYTFADPELESLSAGQKLLIRVGPANAARLKAKLREIRELLATGAS